MQLGGAAGGTALIVAAGALKTSPFSTALMLLGFLAIYVCTHALAHWAVGRMVGLRFACFGIRGTDHPENYPPGFRELMSALPMFTAVSTRDSRAAVGRWGRAAYFAAGETATTVCSLLAAVLAMALGVPGARVFFIVMIVFSAAATVITAIFPKGDYAKALDALRHKPQAARP